MSRKYTIDNIKKFIFGYDIIWNGMIEDVQGNQRKVLEQDFENDKLNVNAILNARGKDFVRQMIVDNSNFQIFNKNISDFSETWKSFLKQMENNKSL